MGVVLDNLQQVDGERNWQQHDQYIDKLVSVQQQKGRAEQ